MLCWEKSPTFCVQGIDIAPSNIQLKYSNYVAFSHFHGCAVNNIGLINLQETNEVDITEHPEILQYAFGMNKLNAQTLLKWQYQTQDKDLKPDFMPERMDGYCDIMEFKMPNLDGKCIVGTNERICLIML